jgi:hypothetical protein
MVRGPTLDNQYSEGVTEIPQLIGTPPDYSQTMDVVPFLRDVCLWQKPARDTRGRGILVLVIFAPGGVSLSPAFRGLRLSTAT